MEALGVAMAAGQAEGIGVWDLGKEPATPITHDSFVPTTTHEGKIILTWQADVAHIVRDKINSGLLVN